MSKRIISAIMVTLLLIGMLTLAFYIQLVESSGTIYIRADGSIDPPTANIASTDNVTYRFTDNNYDSIEVHRNNTIIDGKGYTLQGSGSGNGFYLCDANNVRIQNVNIESFSYGIYLDSSSRITVAGNNITNNYFGIELYWSSSNTVSGNKITNCTYGIDLYSHVCNNTVSGNNITDNYMGIRLYTHSHNNAVSGNNITSSTCGIYLDHSSDNVLRNNSMIGNYYNFRVEGEAVSDFVNDIDASNTVDDKPIYYWVSMRDVTVPLDAGYVALVNSTNITVEGLELTKNNRKGLLLAYTNNSRITNNNVTNNGYGIYAYSSCNNTVSENNITKNNVFGVCLTSSSNNNTISGNNIVDNRLYTEHGGLQILESCSNIVSGNNITNNYYYGIWIDLYSNNNTFSGNNITNNPYGVWLRRYSFNNKFYHNNFIDNAQQVRITTSGYANVWDNSYPSGGNYWSNYTGIDLYCGPYQNETGSDGIGDTPYIIDENNTDRYPLMKPYADLHDIGLTNITTSKTVVGQGYSLHINITIFNYGDYTENFNVTVYANTTEITTFSNITLTSGNSITMTFHWTNISIPKGNYTISAYAWPVPDEVDIEDNTLIDDWVFVTIPGDVDGDFDVDIYDVVKITGIYGSKRGDPQFNPNSDLDDDGEIKIYDVVMCTSHYGQSW